MNIPVKQSIACTVLSLAVAHGADSSAPREVARPLPLAAVRLTDAPLKQAQDLDAAYPLSLELDRLLAGYWLRAGLEPRAKGYGGSDSVEGKQLAGHITGHYLSVVSLMCAATGDGRFKERADQLALRFKEVQDKPGTSFEATDGNEIAAVSGIRMIRAGEQPAIRRIDPPEQGFFSKRLDYHGIPIKAHKTVSDEALREAYQRLDMMLRHLPEERAKLAQAGARLHIIGKDQVTSDLPEHRHLKGKAIESYGGQTVDERTRGLGGLLSSCGEENLLRLAGDRYLGRDICVHEFAHNIRNHGMTPEVRAKFDRQRERSLEKRLWVDSYAGSNSDEFFAELSMWYFGTHGDMGMSGPKPAAGREGLRAYDPEAFALFESFYTGALGG
jgi:hypothetical protein